MYHANWIFCGIFIFLFCCILYIFSFWQFKKTYCTITYDLLLEMILYEIKFVFMSKISLAGPNYDSFKLIIFIINIIYLLLCFEIAMENFYQDLYNWYQGLFSATI